MKRLICSDGERRIEEMASPMIPDESLFARFRQAVDCGIAADELASTLDTRYLQPFLYFLPRTIHARTLVEIGAGRGGSTLPLLKAAAEMSGVLYSVDPSHDIQPYARDIAKRYGAAEHFVACEMTSDEFFRSIGRDLTIDFAFIDGDHHYQAVVDDARNVLDRLVSGGIAVFHEYDAGSIPPWSSMESWPRAGENAEDYVTPRALREALSDYDVDTMPLHFGACGLDRVDAWTERGAVVVRKRLPGEFRIRG